jgi:glyoxylase-like metal-dependent hydrolase (beta-lactamase superfamily II)/rhodanese-related sulfurtransferase
MRVEQLYTDCLAEAAYYIESEGEVAIIDPLRETSPYIDMAKAANAKIKYVFETHFHADFVSGHVDLASKTGATIIYGPNAKPGYEAHIGKDNEEFKIGKVTIKLLHTPGHTMESSSFLLIDEHGKNTALFSGDTLFIGDVGRPDLAVKSDLTVSDLAGHLFDSLRNKIMTLEDDVIIYPGHGAGSACGKNMSDETFDTLGHQKETNYALRADMTREEFVHEVTDGLSTPPQYFPKNAKMNIMGYENFDTVMEKGNKALSLEEFRAARANGALILDTRDKALFPQGFIPGSLFIGLDGSFAPWVGALIEDLNTPIIFIAEKGREEEVVRRLSRVGYDNTQGYLEAGVKAWKNAGLELDTIDEVSPEDFASVFTSNTATIDVRKDTEFYSRHLLGKVQNLPLSHIGQRADEVGTREKQYIHCAGGFRSLIAISILKQQGIHNLVNIQGGFKALEETDITISEYACPSTM